MPGRKGKGKGDMQRSLSMVQSLGFCDVSLTGCPDYFQTSDNIRAICSIPVALLMFHRPDDRSSADNNPQYLAESRVTQRSPPASLTNIPSIFRCKLTYQMAFSKRRIIQRPISRWWTTKHLAVIGPMLTTARFTALVWSSFFSDMFSTYIPILKQ